MYKKKGFTLVELLVVIAIIALLMGILMPALARVRNIAMRMTCGTNLSGIGKAILIYAGDYDDEFPRGGYSSRSTLFKQVFDWMGVRNPPYGDNDDPFNGQVSITSCFYLLIKYADVMPKLLICKNDTGSKVWSMAIARDKQPGTDLDGMELIDLWDMGRVFSTSDDEKFGPDMYCSYSYQHPLNLYYLTTTCDPGIAVAADRNPWIISPADEDGVSTGDRYDFEHSYDNPDNPDWAGLKKGNAIAHQREGQNVLFADIHVDFEKMSACGIDMDNIYTRFEDLRPRDGEPDRNKAIQVGYIPPLETVGSTVAELDAVSEPGTRKDSYLISNMVGLDAASHGR